MANPDHVNILERGVKEWNEWFKRKLRFSPDFVPDLSGAYFSGSKLCDVFLNNTCLSDAYLNDADLTGAYLNGADLSGAKLDWSNLYLADLRGANMSGAFLRKTNLRSAFLRGANLCKADMDGADLSSADLYDAKLNGCRLAGCKLNEANCTFSNFTNAILYAADLTRSNFKGANFTSADLTESNINEANLRGAHLIQANLQLANISSSNLAYVNIQGATIGRTVFANTDLSRVGGLETVIHRARSTIGIDTIFKSKGTIPAIFLRGSGLPDGLTGYIPSLLTEPFEFYSCFISHSSKDIHFCDKLHADLQKNGVSCYYFPKDASWGQSLWAEIDKSIKLNDKVIVVTSKNALNSGPVQREIERTLQREDIEGGDILFPIRIDDYIFDGWEHPRKSDIIAKVVGDFSGWETPLEYKRALERLLLNLKTA